MFDKELFYALCKRYDVELSSEYKTAMLQVGDEERALTESDVRTILSGCQSVFSYSNENKKHIAAAENSFLDDLSIAC